MAAAARCAIDEVQAEYSFNSQLTIYKKVLMTHEEGRHVMIWELGQDIQPFTHANSLMTAISRALAFIEESTPVHSGEL